MTGPGMAIATAPVEGRAICDERAAMCRCFKDAGHVDAGDPIHGCDPTRCTGRWSGSYDDEDFRPVTLPLPVVPPRPWDTP